MWACVALFKYFIDFLPNGKLQIKFPQKPSVHEVIKDRASLMKTSTLRAALSPISSQQLVEQLQGTPKPLWGTD